MNKFAIIAGVWVLALGVAQAQDKSRSSADSKDQREVSRRSSDSRRDERKPEQSSRGYSQERERVSVLSRRDSTRNDSAPVRTSTSVQSDSGRSSGWRSYEPRQSQPAPSERRNETTRSSTNVQSDASRNSGWRNYEPRQSQPTRSDRTPSWRSIDTRSDPPRQSESRGRSGGAPQQDSAFRPSQKSEDRTITHTYRPGQPSRVVAASEVSRVEYHRAPGPREDYRHHDGSGLVIRVGGEGFRVGLFFGDDCEPRWRYRQYCYEPHSVVPSPWYIYPELPPYLSPSVISFHQPYCPSRGWSYYRYEPRYLDYDGYERAQLDRSLDRLVQGFEDRDYGRLDGVVPRRGHVEIFQDGFYRYSIGAHDFEDMFADVVEQTRTRRYEILEVRSYGDDVVRVIARQERRDAWDQYAVVYHEYRLELEGGNWVVRRFGASNSRPW